MAADIPAWCARYVGIPYAVGGQDHAGCDCWGLLVLVWREVFGRDLLAYDGPHWQKGADPVAIAEAIALEAARYQVVEPGLEREGDGILLRLRGVPLHIGLVVAPGWMLHSHETASSCIENYHALAWRRRVIGFRRHA